MQNLNPPKRLGRGLVAIIALIAACGFIGILTFNLPKEAGVIFLDRETSLFPYPFTIQNLMHLLFFMGLGELFVRWQHARDETMWTQQKLLPEDRETVLQFEDLSPIRQKVSFATSDDHGFLPFLIDQCILRFQASRSVDQTLGILQAQLEIREHRTELAYNIIRFLVWVIPTIGFMGTVIGISWSLALTAQTAENPNLAALTASLAVAFNTTLIALILSAILVLLLHIVQSKDEHTLNRAGGYCLGNLINRLYTGSTH